MDSLGNKQLTEWMPQGSASKTGTRLCRFLAVNVPISADRPRREDFAWGECRRSQIHICLAGNVLWSFTQSATADKSKNE